MSYLGIDIGGTYIKYALFDQDGTQLSLTQKEKTLVTKSSNHILEQVSNICKKISQEATLEGVAIATAGVVNSVTGTIAYAGYTIPQYTGTPIKQTIERLVNVPCTVINDVNAACLGEFWCAKKKSDTVNSMVLLTIGTGIGGAILIDGQLYEGDEFMAGEVGYLPIDGEFFQDRASTTALLAAAKEVLGYELTGEQFFQMLDSHTDLQMIYHKFIDSLAKGIMTVQYILNPEKIVLGGGIMAQKEKVLQPLIEKIKEIAVDQRFMPKQLVSATLGNDAGLLGAVYQHIYCCKR